MATTYIGIEGLAPSSGFCGFDFVVPGYRQEVQKLGSILHPLHVLPDLPRSSMDAVSRNERGVPDIHAIPASSAFRRFAASSVMSTAVGSFCACPRTGGWVDLMWALYHSVAFRIPVSQHEKRILYS